MKVFEQIQKANILFVYLRLHPKHIHTFSSVVFRLSVHSDTQVQID